MGARGWKQYSKGVPVSHACPENKKKAFGANGCTACGLVREPYGSGAAFVRVTDVMSCPNVEGILNLAHIWSPSAKLAQMQEGGAHYYHAILLISGQTRVWWGWKQECGGVASDRLLLQWEFG